MEENDTVPYAALRYTAAEALGAFRSLSGDHVLAVGMQSFITTSKFVAPEGSTMQLECG